MKRTPIVLLILLALPLLLYFLVYSFSDPVFEKFPYAYKQDSTYYELPAYRFPAYKEGTFDLQELDDKIKLVSFFDQRDGLPTKVLNGHLKRIYDNITDADFIEILSIHFGPDSLLGSYVDSLVQEEEIDIAKWHFVQADSLGANELAEAIGVSELKLRSQQAPFKPFTVQAVSLVDRDNKVRKYYMGTDLGEVKKINEDLWSLIRMEYPEYSVKQ